MKAGEARGYALSHLRSRQIGRQDFSDFDLIIALDQKNLKDIERVRPADNSTAVELFLSYAPDAGRVDMPDPYFTKQFNLVLDLCEAASDGLVETLTEHDR